MRRPTGALVAALLLPFAACTDSGDSPGAVTTPPVDASTSPTAGPTASPTASPTEPGTTQPLVVAIPLRMEPLDLTVRQVRRLASGRADLRAGVTVMPADQLDASRAVATVRGIDPLLEPDRYPVRTAGEGPATVTTLRVVGDIMLDRGVAATRPGEHPTEALEPLAQHLAGADLTVGNLESTLSENGAPTQGDDSFAAPPDSAGRLAALGVDAVSLANNHVGDYGRAALLETLDRLGASELRYFGAGRDLASASRPVVLTHEGVRFGFVGFNAIGETPRAAPGVPGALSIRMPPRTGPLDRSDLAHVIDVVRRLDRRVDVVVVVPHWGEQYTHAAWPVQRQVGLRLVEAGADLVAGGHPHWVQGLDHLGEGAVLAHSLGNLVFDMDFMEQTMEGVTLTATFWDDRLMRVALTPYRMDATFAPRLVRGPVGDSILADVWASSSGPFRS